MLIRDAEPCKHIQPSEVNTRNRERAQADVRRARKKRRCFGWEPHGEIVATWEKLPCCNSALMEKAYEIISRLIFQKLVCKRKCQSMWNYLLWGYTWKSYSISFPPESRCKSGGVYGNHMNARLVFRREFCKMPGGHVDNRGVSAMTMESTFPNGKHPQYSFHALALCGSSGAEM